MSMEMRPMTVAEFFNRPEANDIIAEYTAESGNPDLGSAMPSQQQYEQMESSGILSVLGAFEGDSLVGFVSVVVTMYPHFGKLVGSVESIWLRNDKRAGSAGLRLLKTAFANAKERGAVGCYLGARHGSRQHRLYERLFQPMNVLFWKKL